MEDVVIRFESASAVLKERDGMVQLRNVQSKKGGLGHGTGVMLLVCKYADRHQLDLYLQVRPYRSPVNPNVLNVSQLIVFYEKFGFRKLPNSNKNWMLRSRKLPTL